MIGRGLLELFDLESVELDGCFATKHGDHDFDLPFLGVDFGDGAFEALERTVDDGDDFAHFVADVVFRIFDAHAFLDFLDFFLGLCYNSAVFRTSFPQG